ncbi:AMP-binding protein [Nocardia salmonicida]|uniref:AMP-binding protein n=1 Tax=Nocardia salmonicida TaxID=53431 RepID=UPI00341B230B
MSVRSTGASLSAGERHYTPSALTAAIEDMVARCRHAGLGAGDRVVLRTRLSDRYVIALLAVIELECCVVPLDPSTPPTMIESILALTAPTAVISDDEIITCETGTATTDYGPHRSDAAYILFTSGTTGEPKGVIGTRRGLAARIDWAAQYYFGPETDRCAIKTAPTFIDSLTEILGAYRSGKTLVVAPALAQRDLGLLADFLESARIEQVTLTPSCVPVLVAIGADKLTTVRRWILTGEELRRDWLHTLRGLFPAAEVINSYGSTEVCGDVIFHIFPAGADTPDTVPIGRAAPGVQLSYDDDAAGSPADAELWVGGDQVALGYLASPRAAESDRFRYAQDGTRWYRTGDIVRRTEGLLYFVGRGAGVQQVRGRRVDVGAVAAALESVDGVEAAHAWVSHGDGPSILRAAVIARQGANVSAASVREAVRTRFLSHLVPDRVDLVVRFRRTASGKVDPRATVADADGVVLDRSRFATGLQYLIAAAVSAAVRDSRMGPTSSFADLGLDSLSAVRVAEEIARHYGVRVTGLDVLAADNVEELATRIPGLAATGPGNPVRQARDGDARRVLVVLHPAIGTCLCYFPLLQKLSYPGRVLYIEQDDRARALLREHGMTALAHYYADEIALHTVAATIDVIGYSFGALLAPTVARRLRDIGAEVSSLGLVDPAWATSDAAVSEDLAVRRVLTDAGYRDLPERPLDLATALGVVRAIPGPLRSVSADTLRRWSESLRVNMIHGVGYEPDVPSVATLVVRATTTALRAIDADWLDALLTDATAVTIDCTHFELLNGAAAGQLAAALSAFLRAEDCHAT